MNHRINQHQAWSGLWLLLAAAVAAAPAWEEHGDYRRLPVQPTAQGSKLFTRLPPAVTGVHFANWLAPENGARNQNLINGSGVALGDVDGDGLCDIYFCSLNGTNALFRNLGNWRFADITAASGLALSNTLARAAVLADMDSDGDLDLLLTFNSRGVRLFLNQGRGVFAEHTQAGLTPTRGGSSAAVGDLNGDGKLDLYVANYGEETLLRSGGSYSVRLVNGKPVVTGRWARRVQIVEGRFIELGEIDDVYLNQGDARFQRLNWLEGQFLNEDGKPLTTHLLDFGLSIQIRDLNQDGLPDIYVCNDFYTPDRCWLQDAQGRFRLCPPLTFRTIPYASMGMDAGDLDRDGRLDLFLVEMRPREHERLVRQVTGAPATLHPVGWITNRILTPRNVLAWNRGDGTYAELAFYAGLAGTDWSWLPVFLDADLDGYEDILIANGIAPNVNDTDFLKEMDLGAGLSLAENRRRFIQGEPYTSPNYAFRNRGDLTFESVGRAWGFDALELSHGMALGDLDNDGDLDVVINCLNAPALLYRNESTAPRVAVRLQGRDGNTHGLNATIRVSGGPVPLQWQEMLGGNRYLSSDDTIRTFAAGNASRLTLEVIWRDGRRTILRDVPPNAIYEIRQPPPAASPSPAAPPLRAEAAPAQ